MLVILFPNEIGSGAAQMAAFPKDASDFFEPRGPTVY